jgi:hypothetical protein
MPFFPFFFFLVHPNMDSHFLLNENVGSFGSKFLPLHSDLVPYWFRSSPFFYPKISYCPQRKAHTSKGDQSLSWAGPKTSFHSYSHSHYYHLKINPVLITLD